MAEWSNLKDGYELSCAENRESDEFNNVYSSEIDNDVKWEDCDNKFRCLFDQVLLLLLRDGAKNGTRRIPALLGNGESVDLFKLFCLVRDRGGFTSVSKENLWGLVAEKLGFDYELCPALKLTYFKYLDELDSWLNRINRERVLANGSYDGGGNLSLLSLELEKRFRDFSTHRYELVNVNIVYDQLCENIGVAKGSLLNSVVQDVVKDDDDKLFEVKVLYDKEKQIENDVTSSRKRKRDVFVGMLGWMVKVAKNPCHSFNETIPGCSNHKEKEGEKFTSVSLMVREARLRRRYVESSDKQTPATKKKQKMHPSLYEDDTFPSHRSSGGPCCKPCLGTGDQPQTPRQTLPKNGSKEQEREKPDNDLPVEKKVLIGPEFQVQVPPWTGFVSESDPKWLGTQMWAHNNSPLKTNRPGKGRTDICNCPFPGSVECYRFHIAEKRMKLRRELGLQFYHWKFDRMGEEVSLSWSLEEEKRFKQVIKFKNTLLGKTYFPKKKWMDLVSYYYNVFLINRRSYQNRVTPKDIDSDDDEAEFGSVSEAFGYSALRGFPKSEILTCYESKQVIHFP